MILCSCSYLLTFQVRQTCFGMSCTANTFSRQLNATWQEETDLNAGIDPIIIFKGCLVKFLFTLAIGRVISTFGSIFYFSPLHLYPPSFSLSSWFVCWLLICHRIFVPGWSLHFSFVERWKRSAQFCTCNKLNLWLMFGRSSGLCLTFIAALECVTVTSNLKTFW